MKICFNQATTMKNSTLAKDLELCEKHGYDFIEIRIDKLRDYLKSNSVDDLVEFFNKSNIKPYAFNALEFINFRTEAEFAELIDTLKFIGEVGEKINCKKVVVVPTFDVCHYTVPQIQAECVDKINQLYEVAKPFGMKLAFEFVGYPNCSVNTFGQAYDIVKAVDKADVGIVLDCFHFYSMRSNIEDLKACDPKKIFIFHMDDSEDLVIGAARDNNRLMPGEGAIDLNSILSTLKSIGYDEMTSIELFRPEYWDWDIEKTIEVGKEKTIEVISKHFSVG